MSANNKLLVSKSNFKVYMVDMDGCGGYVEYTGKNFEDALRRATEIMEDEIVEYGVEVIK